MTTLADAPPGERPRPDTLDVEIVVPVHNEQHDLERSVRRLHGYLRTDFPFQAVITVADNASVDDTWSIAARLAGELDGVRAVHLDAKGRGRALRQVWSASTARVVAYMDVDLSTDVSALLPLVAPLLTGDSDVAIGSRLARSSRVVRGPKRELISRGYNLLLRTTLHTRFSDAQCGFKAMRAEAAQALLPHVQDTAWFFDTELLVLAERSGLRIAEVPVDWTDDPDSRVDILATAVADVRGIVRVGSALVRGRLPLGDVRRATGRGELTVAGVAPPLARQALRFGAIGALSTLAYLLLFLIARPSMGAQAANLIALLVTAIANTAANRRFTFGVRGSSGVGRHQAQGLVVFAIGLGLTSGALWLLAQITTSGNRAVEVGVLVAANLLATLVRFVLLREWVFRRRHGAVVPSAALERTPASGRRERASLAVLLGATGLLHLWGLEASGYANDFYAAAVQAGTRSWKALFFGSFDSSNFITVDKPPAALWPMELSGRLFGFSSWSMLAPQAIEGVLTVWLVYSTVRRWSGHTAGLVAGALLAITPVAVLMFRFNNPDALMTLLVVLAAYCTTRAIEVASARWLVLAGLTMGFAFPAKGLQPFTVLPALALAYLVAAPTTLPRRLLHLLESGLGIVAGAGWWVLAVDLTPASSRPYIGGSGDNSALGLAFGYNGLSRLTGSSGPGGGGANFSGDAGLGRLFNDLNGGQIAWLLPTALVGVLGLLAITERRPRTDRTTAALIVWVGWVLVTGAVLSFAGGIIHTYYDVELAPALAAVVGIAAVELWARRELLAARIGIAAAVVVTAVWSYTLLHRTPSFQSWVAPVVVAAGVVAAGLLLVPTPRHRRDLAGATALAAAVAVAGGPLAYAISTASTAHTGSIPSAGPAAGGAGGSGGRTGGVGRAGGFPGAPGGGAGDRPPGTFPGGLPRGLPGAGGTQSVSATLVMLLTNSRTTWAAAATGSQAAGPLELASGAAVMAIGGFGGSDPAPTLAQFERYVAAGRIHYFIGVGSGRGGPGGSGGATQISNWVASHYTATTVGGATVYDLTKAAR